MPHSVGCPHVGYRCLLLRPGGGGGKALGATPPNQPYQGIYELIDPYDNGPGGSAADLAIAANAGCGTTNPFCLGPSQQAMSGVYLQVKWCNFETYNGTLPTFTKNGQPQTDPNYCNYVVAQTGDDFADAEAKTLCPPGSYQYDTCTIPGDSPLLATLANIASIDQQRQAEGLPDLTIEIGLQAGAASALNALTDTSIGNTDIPVSASGSNLQGDAAGGTLSGYICAALPNLWTDSFLTRYTDALDTLVNTVAGYVGSNGIALLNDIAIVKVTPANVISEEFDTGGQNSYHSTATDINISAYQFYIACPTRSASNNNGAYQWYASFLANHTLNTDCGTSFSNPTFVQGTECTFGAVVGNMLGLLNTLTLTKTIVSIPNNNGAAFPYLDCGPDETGSAPPGGTYTQGVCAVQPSANTNPYYQDQWSAYYYYRAGYDLFNANTKTYSSPAYVAASVAYSREYPGHTYSPSEERIATDFTGLTGSEPHPSDAQTFVTCGLNDSKSAFSGQYGIAFTLYGTSVAPPMLIGTGNLPSWQTNTGLFANGGTVTDACMAGSDVLGPALSNGIANGGQFIEVQPELGFQSDFINDLSQSLTSIQTQSLPGRCVY